MQHFVVILAGFRIQTRRCWQEVVVVQRWLLTQVWLYIENQIKVKLTKYFNLVGKFTSWFRHNCVCCIFIANNNQAWGAARTKKLVVRASHEWCENDQHWHLWTSEDIITEKAICTNWLRTVGFKYRRKQWDEGWSGLGKHRTPQTNVKSLVNKNAIKPKVEDPSGNFVWKALTFPLPRDFGQNLSYPVSWIFQPCASMVLSKLNHKNML